MSRVLDVYLYNLHAGQLIQNNSGTLSFAYDKAYLAGENLALSFSLPLQRSVIESQAVKAFFSGLLPDELVRHRLAQYLGVSKKNTFSLLEAIGGECAGALSLYPEGIPLPEATEEDVEVLTDQKLEDILVLLKRRPLFAGEEGLRLSLAGAQDKIAVGLQDNKIALVKGNSPTTHILKPVILDLQDSVHNEVFCMRLASLLGIEVPYAEMRYLNGNPYFLVERYDRIQDAKGHIHRLHQEDFCQVLGIMPDMKYEREGGPNFAKCQDILQQCSVKPAVDQINLIERIIFNYLIGNADAHGKNFSLLYRDKKSELSPAYDLLSTAVYPELASKMAMKIGGKYTAEEVLLRHWHRLVPESTVARRSLENQLLTFADQIVEQAHELKETLEKEGVRSPIFEAIRVVIEKRAKQIKGQLL